MTSRTPYIVLRFVDIEHVMATFNHKLFKNLAAQTCSSTVNRSANYKFESRDYNFFVFPVVSNLDWTTLDNSNNCGASSHRSATFKEDRFLGTCGSS